MATFDGPSFDGPGFVNPGFNREPKNDCAKIGKLMQFLLFLADRT